MFRKLPEILTADELLEIAFKRTKKVKIQDRDAFYRRKKTALAKTESFCNYITTTFQKYVKKFPSLEQLPMFYQEIIDIKINTDSLKKSLGAVDWAKKTIEKIFNSQFKNMKRSGDLDFILQKQNELYGRISSIVKQIKKELKILKEAQRIIKKLPGIEDIPTVVIAGYPNVGKSSLLTNITKAKPHIATYPFTTKEIHVGHIKYKEKYENKKIQLIDTPGLLDRPTENRNKIEQQAIAALTHLADIIIFIYDPSETSGYPMSKQQNLYRDMKKMFTKAEFIIVENKTDIKKTDSNNIKISCENQIGIKELKEKIIEKIKTKKE
jgi:nucleolar GTP-binding protein